MPKNPLEAAHRAMGAFLVERAGTPMAAHYRDAMEEHAATRAAVGVFDLFSAGKIAVRGPERARFLQRLLAADLSGLDDGRGAYSLLLSQGGRTAAETRVLPTPSEVLLLTPSLARAKARGILERNVGASDVEIVDESEARALLALVGPSASRVLSAALGKTAPDLAPFESVGLSGPFGPMLVASSPRCGEPSFDVLVAPGDAERLFHRFVELAKRLGGGPAGIDALESLRVEAGVPAYGADFDETTLPTEIADPPPGLAPKKGCFLGYDALMSEPPPTRRLAGVVFEGFSPPVKGDKLFRDGEAVGAVTSGAMSPRLERPVGLAMLSLDATVIGTARFTSDGGTALVSETPFRS
jgi:aminomethyltransferase